MLVVPTASALTLLDSLLGSMGIWVHLYVNDVTLGPTTALSDLTEATWPGYAPVAVGVWSPSIALGVGGVSWGDPIEWSLGSVIVPADVYGYYATLGKAGPLAWAEAAPNGPVPMKTAGDVVLVIPQLTLTGVTVT